MPDDQTERTDDGGMPLGDAEAWLRTVAAQADHFASVRAARRLLIELRELRAALRTQDTGHPFAGDFADCDVCGADEDDPAHAAYSPSAFAPGLQAGREPATEGGGPGDG